MRLSRKYIVLYCVESIHSYSASCSAHQSEALPVRETQREESSLERTKRGTWSREHLFSLLGSGVARGGQVGANALRRQGLGAPK